MGDAAAFSVMIGVGETYFAAFALALGTGETIAGLVATLPMRGRAEHTRALLARATGTGVAARSAAPASQAATG